MNNLSPEEFEYALQQCATEPIHQIGNIQPHGAALVVSSDSLRVVLQSSKNLDEFFDLPPDGVCGKRLEEIIGETAKMEVEELIQLAVRNNTATGVISVTRNNSCHELAMHLYVSDGMFVLELTDNEASHQEDVRLAHMLLEFQQSLLDSDSYSDLYKYLEAIATFVQLLTNYDSVMVYRFDTDWNGEVISQDRVTSAPSYLGMHFPASDIPPQARRLYSTNLVRIVVDSDAIPVPVLPLLNPETQKPLDMTYSALRSLSPIHIEYLRNIGVHASMVISLIQNGRLWGLIACHHMSPKPMTIALRDAAIFISRMVSERLASFEAIEHRIKVDKANSIVNKLLKSITTHTKDEILQLLLPELQILLDSSGMIVVIEGKVHLCGVVPVQTDINSLLSWLGSQKSTEIFSCDYLSKQFEPAARYADIAAGLLTTPLSREIRNCIIWLRKEKPLTVNWAGKYEDGIVQNAAGEFRLTPRKSFEIWTESWRGRCEPWTLVEIGIASMLALALPESLAQKSIIETEQEKVRQAEESLRITASVFESSQEGIFITDVDNNIVDVNPAFSRITGYGREEVIGKNPKLLSSGRHDKEFYAKLWSTVLQEKRWRGEIWNRQKSGKLYAELLSISVICDKDGKVQHHVAVFSDISHIKEHEAELSRIAHFDTLTGIPNRTLLADRMKQALAQASRDNNMMAICYLDLDGFKPINDAMGHEAGDAVLIEIAKRLERTIRGGDTVARLGGDEFVVLLLELNSREECVATLERLLLAIAEPITINNEIRTVSASIGVSIYPLDNENHDILLSYADQAMYAAKKSGKNRFETYDQISKSNHVNRKDN